MMEASTGHGRSLPVPFSQHPPIKEWRSVSEHSFHNNGGEERETGKFGKSEERKNYEEVTGPHDVDFCSITIDDGGLPNEILQSRLREVSRRREELEHLEMEFRAQAVARTKIMEMQRRWQSQIREHVDATTQLKDQLKQSEQQISELKVKLEEKDGELRSIWAKEHLLREQNKELATFRSELDNSDVERSKHLKQIHDLQEHFREKESEFVALEEQHKIARENILYKDEQLREAQAWIAQVQVDALQSTANQSLQTELRVQAEQFNQFWIAFQRQFVEMERYHIQTMQQLRLELAEARKVETNKDGSLIKLENSTDSSSHLQKEHQMNAANDGISSTLTHPVNEALSTSASSINTEHASGVPVFPSLLGIGPFLPAGQMSSFLPFVMRPQGVLNSPSSTNSMISQSYFGNVLPASPVPVQQYCLNEQKMMFHDKCLTSQLKPNLVGSGSHFSHEISADGNVLQSFILNSYNNQDQSSIPAINESNEEIQVAEISSKRYQLPEQSQEGSTANSHVNAAFRCERTGQRIEHKDYSIASFKESQESVTASNQQCLAAIIEPNAAQSNVVGSNSAAECIRAVLVSSAIMIPNSQESSSVSTSKAMDHTLLDETTLLACIVRAIPAGSDGQIRISSTLPNRLGKMLAPLRWHDYKKRYGKLDDFVSRHPELFVIEGDFIHLREGAQEIISATTAVAKVAAAATSSVSYSSLFPSVAVTPVSQNNRHKKLSVESKSVNSVSYFDDAASNNQDSYDRLPMILKSSHPLQSGSRFNFVQEMPDTTASIMVDNGLNRALTDVRQAIGGKPQGRSSVLRGFPGDETDCRKDLGLHIPFCKCQSDGHFLE